jgi:hypothetical protein
MRMFKISHSQGDPRHEPARGRSPEELQHHLTHIDGLKFVRVREYISGGAKAPDLPEDDEE